MAENEPQSRNEAIVQNILGATNEIPEPQSRMEVLLQEILGKLGGGGDVAAPAIGYKISKKQNIEITHSTEAGAKDNAYLILTQNGVIYIMIADGTATAEALAGYTYTATATVEEKTVTIDLGYASNVGVIIPVLAGDITSVSFS
jgi:hypothetical protein